MRQFNLYEAKTQLSRLVDDAAAGEDIVIAKHGKPMVRLVRVPDASERRPSGLCKGEITFHPGWEDDLPADMLAPYMPEGDEP